MVVLFSLIGVVVGAILGLASTMGYDRYKEHRTRKRLARAISEEIKSLLQLAVEKRWEKFILGNPEEIEGVELTATYNYFTVYESHADLVSLFDQELVGRIVRFYNGVKSLLEDVKLYSEGVKDYGADDEYRRAIKSQYERLKEEARSIVELTERESDKRFMWFFG